MGPRGSSALFSLILASGLSTLPAFCGNGPASEDGSAGSDTPAPPPSYNSTSIWEKDDPSAWKIAIYPVYAWAPVLGAHVNLPNINLPSGGILTPTGGTVTGSFNGAGFAGFDIEKSRVITHGQFLYASLSGDNTNPKLHLGLDVMFGQVMGGYKILNSLYLEGGVRRMALKISASANDSPEVSRKPGLWDPLIGTTWKHTLGRKWQLAAHLDGGGFGVGSDVTLAASARADWRFAKHFGLTMGASALHFQITDTILDQTQLKRTLAVRQTLWGPVFGFGIYF